MHIVETFKEAEDQPDYGFSSKGSLASYVEVILIPFGRFYNLSIHFREIQVGLVLVSPPLQPLHCLSLTQGTLDLASPCDVADVVCRLRGRLSSLCRLIQIVVVEE